MERPGAPLMCVCTATRLARVVDWTSSIFMVAEGRERTAARGGERRRSQCRSTTSRSGTSAAASAAGASGTVWSPSTGRCIAHGERRSGMSEAFAAGAGARLVSASPSKAGGDGRCRREALLWLSLTRSRPRRYRLLGSDGRPSGSARAASQAARRTRNANAQTPQLSFAPCELFELFAIWPVRRGARRDFLFPSDGASGATHRASPPQLQSSPRASSSAGRHVVLQRQRGGTAALQPDGRVEHIAPGPTAIQSRTQRTHSFLATVRALGQLTRTPTDSRRTQPTHSLANAADGRVARPPCRTVSSHDGPGRAQAWPAGRRCRAADLHVRARRASRPASRRSLAAPTPHPPRAV